MTRINRRTALRRIAGVSVLVTGGLVWRAWDSGVLASGEGAPYEPWVNWREDDTEGPMAVVLAGILAANAHNTQPWRFDVGGDRIVVLADTSRHLGSFDPFRREMMLSLGCALENMVQAARAEGYRPRVVPEPGRLVPGGPEAANSRVAVVELEPGERRETDLYRAISERHTHRGAYDSERPVPTDLRSEIHAMASGGQALFLLTDDARKGRFAELTTEATEAIIADAEMSKDSARWFRFDPEKITRHRDGVTIDAFGLPPVLNAAVKMLPGPDPEQADQQWLEATRDVQLATAPLFGMIAVRDLYRREIALSAGRLWQRLHLWATARGLAAQPMNQLPETVDREAQLGKQPRTAEKLTAITDDPSWLPTFCFRLGYASMKPRPSPRRALGQVTTT